MTHGSTANQPVEIFLMSLSGVVAGIAANWLARKIQRRFTAKVDKLPEYPIVLSPQRWPIILFSTMALALVVLALSLVAVPVFGHRPIDGALIPSLFLSFLSILGLLKVYAFSRESVLIEAEKLVYSKWLKTIEINRREIESFSLHRDFLHIKRRSEKNPISISLCFHNVKYLNTVLDGWCPRQNT